jgi:hypothetical protein
VISTNNGSIYNLPMNCQHCDYVIYDTTTSTWVLVGNVIAPSWDCNNGICSDPGNGMGSFIDSLQCIINCSSTHITDFDNFNAGKVIKIVDVLGQETPYRKRTPLFYIYDDGTVEKKMIIE